MQVEYLGLASLFNHALKLNGWLSLVRMAKSKFLIELFTRDQEEADLRIILDEENYLVFKLS